MTPGYVMVYWLVMRVLGPGPGASRQPPAGARLSRTFHTSETQLQHTMTVKSKEVITLTDERMVTYTYGRIRIGLHNRVFCRHSITIDC